MGNIALLIIAIAFAVLVVFLVIVLHKVSKVVEEANRTVKLVWTYCFIKPMES